MDDHQLGRIKNPHLGTGARCSTAPGALDFTPTTEALAMLVKTSAIPQQSRTSDQSNPSPIRRQKICLTPATMPVWLTPGATVVDVTTPRFDLPLLFMYEAFTYRSVRLENAYWVCST